MEVISVVLGSLAEAAGIRVGDVLEEINGEPIRDVLDYLYWSHDEILELVIRRKDAGHHIHIDNPGEEDIGLSFGDMKVRHCGNHCIFCFIDQLPRGLRDALYIKDEDYRLSFLHGNYVTLTHVTDADLERIIEYRLSPLYISVHTTDPDLRGRMLGRRAPSHVLDKIARLAQARIEMQCQIVLCPGINDGPYLEQSLEDLSVFAPHVRSVAVVPVGLTRFREGLTALWPVTEHDARNYVESWPARQIAFQKKLGTRWAYLADEFHILAKTGIPSADSYEEFPQLENGVGLVRSFIDAFEQGWYALPKQLPGPCSIVLVTGALAADFLEDLAGRLNQIANLHTEVVIVHNQFFGESVTVSGLLTGEDIIRTLSGNPTVHKGNAVVILPPNCVNEEGLFLDNISLAQLKERLPCKVFVGTYDLIETLRQVFELVPHENPS